MPNKARAGFWTIFVQMGGIHSRLQCYCCLLLLMHIELHRLSTLHSIMIVETACWACTCTYKLVLLQLSRWWPCEPYTAHPAAVFVGDNESKDHSHSSHCWRCLHTQTIPDKVPAWGSYICIHCARFLIPMLSTLFCTTSYKKWRMHGNETTLCHTVTTSE